MNITYNNRTLRIDCNEIGFSKKNVAALCKIGQSSKSGLDNSRRYIGEKGIGFKSVFKVAHIVWIHSNHYSFRFDKGRDLGMIAPVWADFPAEVIPGVTSMVMKLDPECNTTELIREIQSLDSRLLIFLQNLKRINIQVTEEGNYTWKTSLERHDEVSGSKSYQLVTLRHGKIRHSYSVFSHKVINLPSEKNRVNITQSQILLAFPIQDEQEARVDPQRVYAFLPIRDYGFKVWSYPEDYYYCRLTPFSSSCKQTSSSLPVAKILILPLGGIMHCWNKYPMQSTMRLKSLTGTNA